MMPSLATTSEGTRTSRSALHGSQEESGPGGPRSGTYAERRSSLEHYFDRTALDAWAQLTGDAPVSKIRATVRAGRDRMRGVLLSWLPNDLTGRRVLDAGCGTGALAVEAARRGAEVVAIDVAAGLIDIARERTPADLGRGRIDFVAGDFLDPALGRFDHVVAMDSLIHYRTEDVLLALRSLAQRTTGSVVFTVTPRTVPLTLMLAAGKLFPRADRAPSIAPADLAGLRRRLIGLPGLTLGREETVSGGFYTSHAMELVRS
jgi:magnesium-protoporphyrin O-methyltransferase